MLLPGLAGAVSLGEKTAQPDRADSANSFILFCALLRCVWSRDDTWMASSCASYWHHVGIMLASCLKFGSQADRRRFLHPRISSLRPLAQVCATLGENWRKGKWKEGCHQNFSMLETHGNCVIDMFQCCSQALVQLCRSFDFDSLQVMEKMIHKEGPEAAMNSGIRSGTERMWRQTKKSWKDLERTWNRLEQIGTDWIRYSRWQRLPFGQTRPDHNSEWIDLLTLKYSKYTCCSWSWSLAQSSFLPQVFEAQLGKGQLLMIG